MVEILDCGRTIAGGYVAFSIRWRGELPETEVQWSMFVMTADGEERVHLARLIRGDRSPLQFVEDDVTGRRVEVDVDATERDVDEKVREVTARFPSEVVGVAVEWPVWRVAVVARGEQLATCDVTP